MNKNQSSPSFSRANHYVPRLYLKRWADSQGKIWIYRLLTSHQNVPDWQQKSTKAVAHHAHLYTKVATTGLTDETERWLSAEFEDPAEESIAKVIANAKLKPEDWTHLIRFLAAQDVRTPARLMEMIQRWQKTLPKLINETLKESVEKLEHNKHEGKKFLTPRKSNHFDFPIKISIIKNPGEEFGIVKAETIPGRAFWLASLKSLLTNTIKSLLEHKWTIIRSPENFYWLTSDDPVVKLNYYSHNSYDFKGGWGSKGTEIFLPISPRHLMYTRIGEKPFKRGTIIPFELANQLQRFTIEHAHRLIFSTTINPEVSKIRPRKVNHDLFVEETEQWRQWHNNQSAAEMDIFGKK